MRNYRKKLQPIYDRTLRAMFEKHMPHVLRVVGLPEVTEFEPLQIEMVTPLKSVPDFVYKAKLAQGGEAIVHVETQTCNDAQIDHRMLLYFSQLYKKFDRPVIYQYLLFMGEEKCTMPFKIANRQIDYEYHLIDLKNVDYKLLMDDSSVENVILSILGNIPDAEFEKVVELIIEKVGSNISQTEEYNEKISYIRGLSGLRKRLEKLINDKDLLIMLKTRFTEKQARDLLFNDIYVQIAKDYFIEKGIEKGIEEGRNELLFELVLKQHKKGLSVAEIAHLLDIDQQMVASILENRN